MIVPYYQISERGAGDPRRWALTVRRVSDRVGPTEWWRLEVAGRVHLWVKPSACISASSANSTREESPSMAVSQSVLPNLLDAFSAGEGVDLVRGALRMVMQE